MLHGTVAAVIPADIPAGWAALLVAMAGLAGSLTNRLFDWWGRRRTDVADIGVKKATATEKIVNSALAVLERAEQDLRDCQTKLAETSECRETIAAERDALHATILEMRKLRNGS